MTTPKTIGRYEILDELGHGAMGNVFRAHDPAMDRTVALKTILAVALASEQGAEYRARFYREARAAGALAHPGIVPVFDVGEHEGVPFLVMEFVQGRTLADAMKRGERMSMERVCEIGQQIAEALGYAHRKGIIHRDIKPANILLTSREVHGIERPRITDFGVAKLGAGEITSTGQMLGTPAFMPPEQFTGAPIDGRTDLFSLGVILYWMATGEQPFPGETMTTVSYKIVHTEPVPPAKLNPAIPAQMEAVILKCLAKSPGDRYQTGEELAQALMEIRTGATTTSLKAAIPQSTYAGAGSDVTLDATPSLSRRSAMASTPAATAAAEAESVHAPRAKKRYGPVVVAAALVVIASAGFLMLHHHSSQPAPAAQAVPPAASPAAQPVAAPAAAPLQTTATATPKKPSAATPAAPTAQPSATGTTPAAAPAPPAAAVQTQATHLAPVTFNPKTLDPKQNTRLKIDFGHFPAGLTFTIEMNGKLYCKGNAGNKSDYDNMLVPPGAHEFRVTVSSASVLKTSNAVSAQFVAKKRMSLKVELKRLSNGSMVSSPAFDSAAQVVATLKEDHFFF